MNTYYFRCMQPDWAALVVLLIQLGALAEHEGQLSAPGGGCWDPIGPIHRPTGETDGEGMAVLAAVVDGEGRELHHANFATSVDLVSAINPDDWAKWFILDAEGHIRAPNNPMRVMAGWEPPPPPSAPPDPTARYVAAVDAHLHTAARSRGYDDIVSACSYAATPNVFQAEGIAYLSWRAACWAHCHQVLADVTAGNRPSPTTDELIAELPALEIS